VSGYRGDGGNSLRTNAANLRHHGMKFTARGRDNDASSSGNCANWKRGGWWFNACFKICLMCSSRCTDQTGTDKTGNDKTWTQ